VIRRSIVCFIVCFVVCFFGAESVARAAPGSNDAEADALVESVFETDYLDAKFAESLEKLQLAVEACAGKTCSSKVIARVWVGIGIVMAGGLGDVDGAKAAFMAALQQDSRVSLIPEFVTKEVELAFNAARKETGSSGGSVDDADEPAECKPFTGEGPRPRGWKNAEAYHYYRQALAQEQERSWRRCFQCAQDSLAAETRVNTRFLSASCGERAGLWLEALGDFEIVAGSAARVGLHKVGREAASRANTLEGKMPKIILRAPAKVSELEVRINNQKVAEDKLGGEIWVNPGERIVTATGTIGGEELEFESTIDVGESETETVDIKLVAKGSAVTNAAIMKCMAEAKTKDDFASCIQSGGASSFNVLVGLEFSVYHDTDHVDVLAPAVYTTLNSPTSGWTIGGGFLVDVVSAASTDILASASPRWTEIRYVPSVNASQKIEDVTFGIRGNMSVEPDYLATSVGASVAADIIDKRVTPTLSYEFSFDKSGRAGTSFETFSNDITRHGIDAGLSVVMDKATVLGLSFTAVLEDGDNSKPYRYVPLFRPGDVSFVPGGFAIEGVNGVRQPERVIEQLPTDRQRYALAGRIARRFSATTLRIEERLYGDSWGVKATTTDAMYLIDVGERMRIWPHLRLHVQTGADFWQLAYASRRTSQGLELPALRTGDRELGPLYSATGGGGVYVALGAEKNWGVTLSGDVVYSRFLDHLFIVQRFAYFGALGLEVEFK